MSKRLQEIAMAVGIMTEKIVSITQSDMGILILNKKGALGLFCGGKKGEFNENVIPFFKEAIKKLQDVVAAHESGDISLTGDDGGFQWDSKEGKFKPLDENLGEWGFSV